jgi:hypothetical protein
MQTKLWFSMIDACQWCGAIKKRPMNNESIEHSFMVTIVREEIPENIAIGSR